MCDFFQLTFPINFSYFLIRIEFVSSGFFPTCISLASLHKRGHNLIIYLLSNLIIFDIRDRKGASAFLNFSVLNLSLFLSLSTQHVFFNISLLNLNNVLLLTSNKHEHMYVILLFDNYGINKHEREFSRNEEIRLEGANRRKDSSLCLRAREVVLHKKDINR